MDQETDNSPMRFLREPVVHFVLVGLAIFALDSAMAPEAAPDEIVVTEQTVERMRGEFETRHGRAPDASETSGLIETHVREEVLYREALALGLHRSDPIVRRRMIQAMEFLSEDLAPLPEPTDEQLEEYLADHRSEFEKPARISLQHIFFAEGEDASSRASSALEKVRAGDSANQLGDAFVHGQTIEHAGREKLRAKFGGGFAGDAMALEPGVWSEPIESSYGVHLVYVDTARPAGQPGLEEVRHRVEVAWRREARERANEQALERLRDSYEVRVEWEGTER